MRAVFGACGLAVAAAVWPAGSAQAESAAADTMSCDTIISAVMQGRDTAEVVRDAALAGMAANDVALCARNAGGAVDDVLAGLDAANVAPTEVAEVAESLETAAGASGPEELDFGPAGPDTSPVEQEFLFLLDITRASGYEEGLVGCSIVARMVRDNPDEVDEVVRSAAGAGMVPDDVASCALAAGAEPDDVFAGLLDTDLPPDLVAQIVDELEPASGTPGPLPQPGDPADISDPALGEPKIIRPNSPNGAPDAASPA